MKISGRKKLVIIFRGCYLNIFLKLIFFFPPNRIGKGEKREERGGWQGVFLV